MKKLLILKHIKKTDRGYVITEFLPDVSWAGAYNTISCGLPARGSTTITAPSIQSILVTLP